jgi:predicted double-glycine peptidase
MTRIVYENSFEENVKRKLNVLVLFTTNIVKNFETVNYICDLNTRGLTLTDTWHAQ